MTLLPVEARGLEKRYGRERALAGVSLTLRRGELCALLGPNGAGKSTLLGILATLVHSSRGAITYGSLGGARGSEHGRRVRSYIGLVAHEPLVYGDLTARENLRFFANLYGVPVDDAEERAGLLLHRFALAAAADRPARTYSRGMIQRLSLCRALLHQPELLLLDEPFTGLDVEGVAALSSVLREERAQGRALLVATHDVTPLAGICDHVLVLRRGRLVADEERSAGELGAERLSALQQA